MVTFTGYPDWTMEILDDNTFGVLEYHGDDTVKTIGFEAFAECTNLSEVVLPETITSIGMLAFRNCYSLKKINIPEECQIEDGAFLNCDCIEHARIGIKERECFSL